jgi:hypothetical protein
MTLITSNGNIIALFVVEYEEGDKIWGTFRWNTPSDCVVKGTFTALIS